MTNDVYSIDRHSEALLLPRQDAQQTFKFFWRELSWERRRIVPAHSFAAAKIAFTASPIDSTQEHMWVNEIEFDGNVIRGILLNTPQWIATLQAGDLIEAPLEDLDDWMYVSEDVVYGGYTLDVIRAQMSPEERSGHDEAWGLDFGNLGEVFVNATGRADPSLSQQALASREHPMSENTAEMFDQLLRDATISPTERDDRGWPLLHREALAGNQSTVAALLRHGADAQALTPDGMTALQLAQLAGWPNIVTLLALPH